MPKVDWESHRSEKRQLDPTVRRIRSLLTILLLAVLAYLLLGGSFRVAFDEESFGISAGRFGSEHIYFSDISALELRDGSFTTGTALDHKPSLRYAVGYYQDGGLSGTYHLFLEKSYTGPVIILTHSNGILVFGADSLNMQTIYNELKTQTNL